MKGFFRQTLDGHLLNDAPSLFDWLFDDEKFEGSKWDANAKRKFTNKIQRIDGFGKSTFKKKTRRDAYPEIRTTRNRLRKPYALFSSGGSMGQDFVRHIRNGIAHGHVDLYKVNGTDYVQLTDKGRNGQTSYIVMPLTYLETIHRLYMETEDSLAGNRKGYRP